MASLWRCAVGVVAVGLCLGLAACQDHDTLPTEAVHISLKQIDTTWSEPPYPRVGELAVSLEIISSSGSRPIEDGVVLTVTTDHWQFDNGQQRVEVETVGGGAVVRVVADAPGNATIRMSGEIGGTQFGLGASLHLSERG